MKCPLCESNNIKEIETIPYKQIVYLYRKILDIDISYLINQDLNYFECQDCKLRFFHPQITGDKKFYDALQKFEWYYMDEKEEYRYASKFIKPTDKVLEIGCGKGAFTKYISTTNYVGLEFSESAIQLAKERGLNVYNISIEKYAQDNPESVDVVVSFQVLEHVENPKIFIEASILSLKHGGVFIIAVPSENSFLKYVVNGILNLPPHHVTRWDYETFKFIGRKYNLEIIDIYHEKVQSYHKTWFISTILNCSFGINKLITLKLSDHLKLKISSVLARFIEKGFKDEMLPNGHTVVVVYRKRQKL